MTIEVVSRLAREALRAGTFAGLAMIPFAALFRSLGLRVNEYGRKTLALVVGDVGPPLHEVLSFAQHMLISWFAAVPLLWALGRIGDRRTRVALGALYGAAFYVVMALPLLFGDRTPWHSASRPSIRASPSISCTASSSAGWPARGAEPAFGARSGSRDDAAPESASGSAVTSLD